MVKDLRTGEQTSNIQKVMDGDIDQFITAWLKAGCPRQRKSGVADED
jgi:peptide chain release factor 2